MRDLLLAYSVRRKEIENRMGEFCAPKTEEQLFSELVFCILTPQSRARTCDRAVKELFDDGVVFDGNVKAIKRCLKGVRFHNTKARNIIRARAILSDGIKSRLSGSPQEIREWLVENVCGIGYKEASHFLRNIGLGNNIAILDRHILGNLLKYGVIEEIPMTITRKRYMEIEGKMKEFSNSVGIPFAHLDLLFWSNETGEVFK